MLVPVKIVLNKVRLKLNDMQMTKFSEYELLYAFNDARQMLWIALAENFSSFPRKSVELVAVDGVAPLPADYYTLVDLSSGVIVGDHVEDGDGATLVYNCVPLPILDATESAEFPASLYLDIVALSALIAQGDTSAAVTTATESARRISQKREISRIPDTVHFP